MKKATVLFVILISALSVFSQKPHLPNPYRFAFGAGYYPTLKDPYVFSFKFYTKSGNAYEFLGYNLQKSWRLTGLLIPYIPIDRTGNLRLLLGPGLHLGLWKDRYKTNGYTTNPIVGGDAIIGFEYRIPHFPISLQGHYQPAIDFAGNTESFLGNTQVGALIKIVF